jgi:hypothetical protein
VYVVRISTDRPDLSKRRRVEDWSYVFDSLENEPLDLEFEDCPQVGSNITYPLASSRISSTADVNELPECPLKSTLISKEAMDRYSKGEEKLRKELKQISLEDHEWHVRS